MRRIFRPVVADPRLPNAVSPGNLGRVHLHTADADLGGKSELFVSELIELTNRDAHRLEHPSHLTDTAVHNSCERTNVR